MTSLTEVFHTIYDLKDEHIENEPMRVGCYKALVYVEQLMEATGVEIPNRHDGEGRPRNVMLTTEFLKARGVVKGTEPAEVIIRRMRDGVPEGQFVIDVAERFALDHPDEEARTAFLHTLPEGALVSEFSNQLDDEAWTLIDDAATRAAVRLGYDESAVEDPRGSW